MIVIFWYFLAVILGLIVWQVAVILNENRYKSRQYRDAVGYAREQGKPLLIAGGLWGIKPYRRWLKMPAHGGGDICLDIDRRALGDHKCGIVADITRIPFADKSFGAVFSSHVLEHLPTTADALRALSEFARVAEAVFIVYPSKQNIIAWVKREHHLWLWQKRNVMYLKQKGKTGDRTLREFTLPPLLSRRQGQER